MSSDKEPMFPILNDPCIKAIPWASIRPHEKQAMANHYQTLNKLAHRGGLSPCEAVAVMTDSKWQNLDLTWARAKLMRIVWDFERAAKAAAEVASPTPEDKT